VRGRMLVPLNEKAIYAAAIVSAKNVKKDIKLVGPQNIHLDKATLNFSINIEGPIDGVFYSDDTKVLELYVRTKQADKT
jgi:hypothetical protein